jgi:hypothetical protein
VVAAAERARERGVASSERGRERRGWAPAMVFRKCGIPTEGNLDFRRLVWAMKIITVIFVG